MNLVWKKYIPVILVLLIAILLIALDRWADKLPKTTLKQMRGDIAQPLKKPKADLFILGSSTTMWLRNKVFWEEAGISKKQYADGLISGGHYDAMLGLVWTLKEEIDPAPEYKVCIVGANYYSFDEDYFNNRSMHHKVFVPDKYLPDLFSYYLASEDSLRLFGNYFACRLSSVYCNPVPYQAKIERTMLGTRPKDPLYPWWWSEITDYYHENEKPKKKKKKHPRLPRGKLTEDNLIFCLADWETGDYKRLYLNRILEELDDICQETVLLILAMPKPCRKKEHKEDIPLYDEYFKKITQKENRHLIDLAAIGGAMRYFGDSVHLIPSRAGLYAKELVKQLKPIMDRTGVKQKPKIKKSKKKKSVKSKSKNIAPKKSKTGKSKQE